MTAFVSTQLGGRPVRFSATYAGVIDFRDQEALKMYSWCYTSCTFSMLPDPGVVTSRLGHICCENETPVLD